jgi:ribonucleoside-diphosphate reductase alpha subunit
MSYYVLNRANEKINVDFSRITDRNRELSNNEYYGRKLEFVDLQKITDEVSKRFKNGMTTSQLDLETSRICSQKSTLHSDYEYLAARVLISDLQKRIPYTMSEFVNFMSLGKYCRYSKKFIDITKKYSQYIDNIIHYERDYLYKIFGFSVLSKSYLIKLPDDESIFELPQYMYARIAISIFLDENSDQTDINNMRKFYDMISTHKISNATPTILNAGTKFQQLSSCFQMAAGDDFESLFDTVKYAAIASKWSGGISIWLHNIRAEGSVIKCSGGRSTGIRKYVKILNEVQLYSDQGGNRPGAFVAYLALDHHDIFTFLKIGRLKGEESMLISNSPDLKYGIWIPDLFWKKLIEQIEYEESENRDDKKDSTAGDWYLFSPDDAPGLYLSCGKEYENLYNKYVSEGRYRSKTKAGEIIKEAYKNWTQGGTPYVLNKDHTNSKSNMKNVAPICSSNLCTEITIPSWSDYDTDTFKQFNKDNTSGEFGVCTLAAICLPSFVKEGINGKEIDYDGIAKAVYIEVIALNKIIDKNEYTCEQGRRSSLRHRPIGIGIMGLADVFALLNIPYGSVRSMAVARSISAVIYYSALKQSYKLAKQDGPYSSFKGSPISEGKLQPDLWVENGHFQADWEDEIEKITKQYIKKYKWDKIREKIKIFGIRNAYLTAYMPTASTSSIAGINECFEPFTSNFYTKHTTTGENVIVNKYLINDLVKLNLWNDDMRRQILNNQGSIQNIENIPTNIKNIYRTAREIHPELYIKMCKSMAPFVCQSMSMNLFITEPNLSVILRFLISGWKEGLKTGMYYCHTSPATGSQKSSTMKFTPENNNCSIRGLTNVTCESCSV